MAHHRSLLGLAALGLIALCGLTEAASASEPRHPKKSTAQANFAPIRQRAVGTSVAIGGDAFASATNQSLALQDNSSTYSGRRGTPLQFQRSPTVQTAVSAAISVGGNSGALASNTGDAFQSNAAPSGTRPIPLTELGRAPRSTAVSTAVSINGIPIAAAR
jgi:hypothetical protein